MKKLTIRICVAVNNDERWEAWGHSHAGHAEYIRYLSRDIEGERHFVYVEAEVDVPELFPNTVQGVQIAAPSQG